MTIKFQTSGFGLFFTIKLFLLLFDQWCEYSKKLIKRPTVGIMKTRFQKNYHPRMLKNHNNEDN